eukprot:COSAG02_NODE_23364_length_721_cov_0.794212_1_plen_44_part_10
MPGVKMKTMAEIHQTFKTRPCISVSVRTTPVAHFLPPQPSVFFG